MRVIEQRILNPRGQIVIRRCCAHHTCGQEFTISERNTRKRYCCRECAQEAYAHGRRQQRSAH